MDRRQYKRLSIELPVTVSGLDTKGNPFSQTATTVEISARGLRLRGISCLRGQRLEPVQVKYRGKSARYRVAWIGEDASSWQGMVGLEAMDDSALVMFGDHLPFDFGFPSHPRADTYVVAGDVVPSTPPAVAEHCKLDRRQCERRRYPRYPCAGNARIWEQGHEIALSARVSELSAGGCFFEMMSPLRVGTSVRLELSVSGATISLEGVLRYSLPNFGMGAQFTEILPAEAEKLHRVIAEMSGAVAPQAPGLPAPPPASLSANDLEDAVVRWFSMHEALTRQEFLELKKDVAQARHSSTHVD